MLLYFHNPYLLAIFLLLSSGTGFANLRTLFTGTGPLQRDKADAPGGETAYSETSGTGRVCLQTRAIFVLYGLSGSPLARLCVFACLAQALDWGHVAQT